MKRLLSAVLLLSLLLIVLSGCYNVQAGELSEVLGTYEMIEYYISGSEADGVASRDYLTEDHAVCYLVISSQTSGYYYYADDSSAAVCCAVDLRLTESDEEGEEGMYSYVEFRTSSEGEWTKYAIHVSDMPFGDHKLNCTDKTYAGSLLDGTFHSTSTRTRKFKRVSRKTDLETVEKRVGELNPIPFS